jgi:hypothetical protein
MKTILLSLIALMLASTSAICQNKSQHDSKNVIQVIDFHSTHRCMTCNNIENKTKAVLDKHFKKEMAAGKIMFKAINVDEKANAKIAEDFEASGTALFINVMKNGKSTKINLTDFAFMNANNKDDSFELGLKKEVEKALQML